eukprot:5257146-Pyramimonas_sp.AAC.1
MGAACKPRGGRRERARDDEGSRDIQGLWRSPEAPTHRRHEIQKNLIPCPRASAPSAAPEIGDALIW